MTSVLFSTIGVFMGLVTFHMDFVIMMTMIGIISLAGIVVNNAIVLIDFIELTVHKRNLDLQLEEITIQEGARIQDVSLIDSPIRREYNL